MAGKQQKNKTLRVPGSRYLNSWRMLLLMFLQAAVSILGVLHTSHFWDDSIVGYFDFSALFGCVWRPSTLLLRFCFKIVNDVIQRHGLLRVLFHLGFVVVTSVTLSAVYFEFLPACAWKFAEKNNFTAKIEENIIRIDARRGFPFKTEHHPRTKGLFPDGYRYQMETHQRYQGEDVQFSCQISFNVDRNTIVHRNMLFWLHETDSVQMVKPSARHFIKTTLTRAETPGQDDTNETNVRLTFTSELRIFLIAENDFGNYTCALYGKYLTVENVQATPEPKRKSEHRHHINPDDTKVPPSKGPTYWPNFEQLMDAMACTANKMKRFENYVMLLKTYTNTRRMLQSRTEFVRSLSIFKNDFFLFHTSLQQTKKCGGDWSQYFVDFMDDKIRHAEDIRASTLTFFKSIHPALWELEEVLPDLEDIGSYRLVEVKPRTEEMRAPHGSLFSLKSDFFHLNEADEITVSYTVNGQSVEFCDEIIGSCSKTVFLYWVFFHDGELYWDILKNYFFLFPTGCRGLVYSRLEVTSRVIMDFWKCLCYKSFGKHEIVFHRFFFNPFTRTTTVHEFVHPHAVYVAPMANELFEPHQNSSNQRDDSPIEKCWSTQNYDKLPQPCSHQEKWMKSSIASFWNWEMLMLVLLLIFWILMLSLLLVRVPIFLAKQARRLILDGELFFRHRALPPNTPLGDLVWNPGLPPVHDIFLSHAEQQCELVRESLVPLLERWGFRVFFRNRDLDLGSVEHMAIARALNHSRKVIVIASPEYTNDHYLNNFEFPFILDAVNNGFVRQQDVLLYRCGDCYVPAMLHGFPSIDASRNALDDLGLQAQLMAWARDAPVALAPGGWSALRLSFPFVSCGSMLVVALFMAGSYLHPVLAK